MYLYVYIMYTVIVGPTTTVFGADGETLCPAADGRFLRPWTYMLGVGVVPIYMILCIYIILYACVQHTILYYYYIILYYVCRNTVYTCNIRNIVRVRSPPDRPLGLQYAAAHKSQTDTHKDIIMCITRTRR